MRKNYMRGKESKGIGGTKEGNGELLWDAPMPGALIMKKEYNELTKKLLAEGYTAEH